MTSIWTTLGVPYGSDRDAIRRGYARKLKTVHPEDDPEGFKALREAYDQALQEAEWAARYGDDQDEDEEVFAGEEAFSGDGSAYTRIWQPQFAPEPAEPSGPSHTDDDAFTAADAREHAGLDALLTDLARRLDPDVHPDPDALIAAFDAIVASPAMGNISTSSGVEAWLAGTIAESIPRSDPLIMHAIATFGWNDNDHQRMNDWHLARIVSRIDEWNYIATAETQGTDNHAGWRALTGPALPNWRMRLLAWSATRRAQVTRILERAEYEMPGLQHHLTPEKVAWWQAFETRPHHSLSTLLLAPLVLLLASSAAGLLSADDAQAGYAVLAAIPLALAAPTLWVRLVKRRQLGWASGDMDPPPGWFSSGWMPAAAAWPFAAMLLPGNAAGVGIAIVLSAVLVLWTTIAQPPVPPTGTLATRINELSSRAAVPLILLGTQALQDKQRFIMWSAVAIAVGTAWVRGRERLPHAVRDPVARLRIPATYWAIPALIGVAVLVHAAVPGTPLPYTAGLMALVGVAVLKLLWGVEPQANGVVTVVMWIALAAFYLSVVPVADTPEAGVAGRREMGVVPKMKPLPAPCPKVTILEPRPPIPCGSPANWVTSDDYPQEALRGASSGTTGYELAIDRDGIVTQCKVVKSSGQMTLDLATCTIMRSRARFLPARNAYGPIPSRWTSRLVWQLGD